MITVREIAERLNENAAVLAPDLLPNGKRSGNHWMASGIDDTGRSGSLAVQLTGAQIGKWRDHGNCAADEESGDILDLVRLIHYGGDMGKAVAWAKHHLGIDDGFTPGAAIDPEVKAKRAEEARQRAQRRAAEEEKERVAKARGARALFLKGGPIAGTPAGRYLKGRGLTPGPVQGNGAGARWPGSLRFFDEVYHGGEKVKLPAMLGGIFNAAGEQIGTHRTFLQAGERGAWHKLSSGQAKMVLGNMWGGFIPINKGASGKSMANMPECEPIYATEGIEDAICVRMVKPAARIIAGISLKNLGAIILPERATKLVIVADRDEKPDEQAALERSIAQQQARGLHVQLVMPPKGIHDFNDWLLAAARARPDGDTARERKTA